METAVLCVGFGTAMPQAREEIRQLEAALRGAAPGTPFATATASDFVRRRMAAQGQAADSVSQALEKLAAAGHRQVAVQPTHLLCGVEYEAIGEEVAQNAFRFARLKLGEPLLAQPADPGRVAAAIPMAYPAIDGEALLLVGHGTEGMAGRMYPALQQAFASQGRRDVFVAAIKGEPSLETVLPRIRQAGFAKIHLVPFLLAAGAHACQDLAGPQPGSWQNRLQAAGFAVHCTLRGLASLPPVRQLYVQKLMQLLEQP